MTVSLDTPAQIGAWQYLSAVSLLALEIKTKTNYYGKTSVYTGIRRNTSIVPAESQEMFPVRATRANKVLLLTALCYGQPSGPVVDSARDTLAVVARDEGIAFDFR